MLGEMMEQCQHLFLEFLTGDDTDHADETDGFASFFNA
jgi:hypothetical protein